MAVISKTNHKQFSDAEIAGQFNAGELVVAGIGFFERIFLVIVSAIRDSKTKLKKRVDALEKENKEIRKELEKLSLQVGGGAVAQTTENGAKKRGGKAQA